MLGQTAGRTSGCAYAQVSSCVTCVGTYAGEQVSKLSRGEPVTDDRQERNRVLGMPLGPGPHARQDEERQHILGFPADSFGPVDRDWFLSLAHPIRTYRRWVRRRLGPFATDEDEL